jgi:integrase
MTVKEPQEPTRLTLQDVDRVPKPLELYKELMLSQGWAYKTNMEYYKARDRALVSILYLTACRISEAIQLKRSQFKQEANRIVIESMLLAKRKPGKVKFREAWLPLTGDRARFTELVTNYLELQQREEPKQERLFPFSLKKVEYQIFYKARLIRSVRLVGTNRAWNIVKALLPNITAHFLRQYGDDYLYDAWDHDIMAVSDYTKQDARTLQLYLRKRYQKYKSV